MKIRINSCTGAIYLGICLEGPVRSNMFIVPKNLCNVEHGHYVFRSTGSAFSDTRGIFNLDASLTFSFVTGDIVTCTYKPVDNKLVYSKSPTSKFEMEIEPPPKGQYYRFCSYLLYGGDEI